MQCENKEGKLIEVDISPDPICGKDFCDSCGDCIACYDGDPCTDGGGHFWYLHFDDERNPLNKL